MIKYLLSTACLTLVLFWPTQAQEIASSIPIAAAVPERFTTLAEASYLNSLTRRGFRLETQGFRIEALDGSAVFADYQSDVPFNPASVIKVATTFAALAKFGPDHRFQTAFYTDGEIHKKTRVLKGNLILEAAGDPNLSSNDVTRLVREVVRAGIARVEGDLIVAGPFSFGSYYTAERALLRLGIVLRRIGIRVTGEKKLGGPFQGTLIATHESATLRDILLFQNAHSSNPIAERLGETLGGPRAVERFLVDDVGIPEPEVFVGRTSGLQHNRITPRGTVLLFRKLVHWLEAYDMHAEDILPVAGVDPGTLQTRFKTIDFRGGIVAKTGTLPGTDGGVSTLAGILYTRDRGPLIFAIFNTKGSVVRYRQLQDAFLKSFIQESGGTGIPPVSVSSRRLSN